MCSGGAWGLEQFVSALVGGLFAFSQIKTMCIEASLRARLLHACMPRAVTLAGSAGSPCAQGQGRGWRGHRYLLGPSYQLLAPGSQLCVDVAGAELWAAGSRLSTFVLCSEVRVPLQGHTALTVRGFAQLPADTQACAPWAAVLSVSVILGLEISCGCPAPGPLVYTVRVIVAQVASLFAF